MIFKNFKIGASPFIHDAYCECGNTLEEVSSGFLSRAMFCPKCKSAYVLRLIKMPKKQVNKEWIAQATEEVERRKKK